MTKDFVSIYVTVEVKAILWMDEKTSVSETIHNMDCEFTSQDDKVIIDSVDISDFEITDSK